MPENATAKSRGPILLLTFVCIFTLAILAVSAGSAWYAYRENNNVLFVAAVALLVAWLVVLRYLREWRKKRSDSQRPLIEPNESLDDKITQRTTERQGTLLEANMSHGATERTAETNSVDNALQRAVTEHGGEFELASFVRRIGDEAFARTIAEAFLNEDLPRLYGDLQRAVADRDAQGIERAAHGLKGALGELRATGAHELARTVELMGKAGELTRIQEPSDRLARELETLTGQLERFVASPG